MYNEDWKAAAAFVVIILLMFLVMVSVYVSVDQPSCHSRTADIGMPSRWLFWGGCQIQVEECRWIPLDNWYYTEKKK
jgi:hypothetical protein